MWFVIHCFSSWANLWIEERKKKKALIILSSWFKSLLYGTKSGFWYGRLNLYNRRLHGCSYERGEKEKCCHLIKEYRRCNNTQRTIWRRHTWFIVTVSYRHFFLHHKSIFQFLAKRMNATREKMKIIIYCMFGAL